MNGVNKVILIGNVGRDPVIRGGKDGARKVAAFSIATAESWKDKETGERKEQTEWHNIVCFNDRITEFVEKYIRKGMRVYVEGQQKTRKYEKDGVERYVTETVISAFRGDVQSLEKIEGRGAPDEGEYGSTKTREAGAYTGPAGGARTLKEDLDDEIPF